jgi:hypothetical protein
MGGGGGRGPGTPLTHNPASQAPGHFEPRAAGTCKTFGRHPAPFHDTHSCPSH